jgi:NAD(P)-dependent dehydrogenase (short-subunit alcohol dehydrogenase family)
MFDNFEGSGAVVTGAANGIGRALAFALAAEGCRIVLVDVDDAGLQRTRTDLQDVGYTAYARRVDVSDPGQVEDLAAWSFEQLGNVRVLCNNAGIVGPTGDPLWAVDLAEWKRVFDVNVIGALNGLRSFLPRMARLGTACHVVNTSSECGWVPSATVPQYFASKHALVSLTESLRLQATASYPWLRATLLCPRIVDTGITEREKKRIEESGLDSGAAYTTDQEAISKLVKQTPDLVAERTIEAMRNGTFYVFPDPESKTALQAEFGAVLAAF